VAVQRPSSLNLSGLIVDGRSSTRCSQSCSEKRTLADPLIGYARSLV